MKLSFLASAKRPFSNLSSTQKLLFTLRCGGSILTIALIIVLAVFQKYPRIDHVARINCGHVDVALGLYRTLQSELRESSTNSWDSPGNAPQAPGLSDSTILMLSDYTQEVVSDAPQSFLLAFTRWCTVEYSTNFGDMNYLTSNKTIKCYPYKTFNLFNYRQMLSGTNLDFILAYTNQSTTDRHYLKVVNQRQRRFNSMRILFYTQALSQAALLISCFVVYSNRGSARDLSKFRSTTLHVVASLAMEAVISISIAAAVVTCDLNRMKKDISRSLGDFGIAMNIGTLFNVLFWMTFCVSIISSFSWILPVWCSNPPKPESELVYSTRAIAIADPSTHQRKDRTYVIKPYRLRRHTMHSGRSSRLFDDDETLGGGSSSQRAYRDHETRFGEDDSPKPFICQGDSDSESTHPSRDISESNGSSITNQYDPLNYSSTPAPRRLNKAESELELRRLGRKMTKNASARTRRIETHELDAIYAAPKEDTHNLLYGDHPFASHQYPHTFGKHPPESLSRGASLNSAKRSNSGRTRQLLDADSPATSRTQVTNASDNISLLNEDEVQYLDQNNFVNRI